MRRWRSVPVLGAAALLVGCSTSSSGAPPLTVCGTVLWSGAAGAIVTDATGTRPVVGILTVGDATPSIVLRLAAGCSNGSSYSIRPAGAATVERVIHARDHGVVAVMLHVLDNGEVSVRHADGTIDLVRIAAH